MAAEKSFQEKVSEALSPLARAAKDILTNIRYLRFYVFSVDVLPPEVREQRISEKLSSLKEALATAQKLYDPKNLPPKPTVVGDIRAADPIQAAIELGQHVIMAASFGELLRWDKYVVDHPEAPHQLAFKGVDDDEIQRLQVAVEVYDRSIPQPASGQEAPAQPSKQAEPEFVFRKQRQGWFIRAFGKEDWFPDLDGFWYIHRLITSPKGEVRMEELVRERALASQKIEQEYQEEMQTSQPDSLADEEALEAVKDRLRDLEKRLHDPDFPPDWEEREKIEQEQEKLEKYLRSVQGLGRRPRKMADPIDKLRPLIRSALKTAYQKLREAGMGKLAQHFDENIKASRGYYRYNDRLPWE